MYKTYTVVHRFTHSSPSLVSESYRAADLLDLKLLVAECVAKSPGVHTVTFDNAIATTRRGKDMVILKELSHSYLLVADEVGGDDYPRVPRPVLGLSLEAPSGRCDRAWHVVYDLTLTYEVASVM